MKYYMKVFVDAEQFLPEEDKIPKGVTSDGPRSPKLDPRAAWVLFNPQQGMTYLKEGDYVITDETGLQYIVPSLIFEATYKPVTGS